MRLEHLVIVSSLVASSLSATSVFSAEARSRELPSALHGVWTVVSIQEDGQETRIVHDREAGLVAGEAYESEIIILRDRLVSHEHDGEGTVWRAAPMKNERGEQIRLWGGRYDEHAAWLIYRIDGDKLTLSMIEDLSGHPEMDFTAEKGSRQMVFVLTRSPESDPATAKTTRRRHRIVGVGAETP